jgi:2-C-methyl-D-erythritol 4-phosphate cytidylyltransferase
VLLGWARWTEDDGWVVLHKGVRRFVRPQLIEDPIDDRVSTGS